MVLNPFENLKTIGDFRRADEEFQMRKQDAMVKNEYMKQLGAKAQNEASELDVKKLGENAFLKIGQGLPLTPQETAAAKFLDAKSGGIQFDPSTGQSVKKPSLFDKMPLDGQNAPAMPMANEGVPPPTPYAPPAQDNPTPVQPDNNVGSYEAEYLRQLAGAAGNPKLEQTIKTAWAKSTMEPGVDEMKASGFADRMNTSNATVGSPAQQKAALEFTQRMKAAVPFVGNKIVSDDYQSFDQAQRDFINAQLRRESGAAISPGEFDNASRQYFPAPGDVEATLAQKRINRENAVKSMIASAGAAYEIKNKKTPSKSTQPKSTETYSDMPIEQAPPIIQGKGNIRVGSPEVPRPNMSISPQDPRIAAARAAGYSEQEIQSYLGGR